MPQAGDSRIIAHNRLLEDHFFNEGIIADDGIFDDGIGDARIVADSDVRPHNRIRDGTIAANAHRVNDDGIIKRRQVVGSIAFAVEQDGVGFQQHFFFSAIEPVVYRESVQFCAAHDHTHQRIGERELAFASNVVFYIKIQRFH